MVEQYPLKVLVLGSSPSQPTETLTISEKRRIACTISLSKVRILLGSPTVTPGLSASRIAWYNGLISWYWYPEYVQMIPDMKTVPRRQRIWLKLDSA